MGATREQAFEQAALAMTAIVADPAMVRPLESVGIVCEAPDDELLFVDWLNGLIYEMSTRRMLFGRYSVAMDGHHLKGMAWGEPVDRSRHHPAVEIKGATYTALRVVEEDGMWLAQTVLDV